MYLQYKPFFLFLFRFIGAYLVFVILYKLYLGTFDVANNEPDNITYLVARQSNWLLNFLGYKSFIEFNLYEPCLNLFCGPNYYVRIVEGCNAISVMILFVSFCIAFSAYFFRTVIYVVFGVFIIYILNIIRIALIVILALAAAFNTSLR